MNPLSKAAKRHFQELAGRAHERELNKALEELLCEFERWKKRKINAFELSEKIHEHHDGISRALYKFYVYSQPTHAVARALAEGILEKKGVNEQYLSLLERPIEFYENE